MIILLRRNKKYMKIRHKKIIASGIAVALVGSLGIGALLETSVSVQASLAMMPGIEEIVNETSQKKPFRILEIVDSEDEAEIGYYVSGQEPYIKLYKYTAENGSVLHFSSLEDGLSKLPAEKRREFATNKKTDENGNESSTGIDISGFCGDDVEKYPMTYSEYQEQYFVSSEDGWEKVNLVDADNNPRTDTVKIRGHYEENSAGNGNYTKKKQTYYPIRRLKGVDVDSARENKYRENIENFYYSDDDEAQAPYTLTFAEVKNEDINKALEDVNDKGQTTILPEYDYSKGKYGYYENVYSDLTEDIVNNIQNKIFKFPGETPVVSEDAVLLQDNTPQGASAFSAGEEEEFSSVNDGSVSADTAGQDGFGSDASEEDTSGGAISEDAFSAGDFSDGDASVDAPDQDVQVTEPNSVASVKSSGESEAKGSERTILIGFADEATKGTTENPYIYLGENIDAYPYYKYTLVGDMKKIQELAAANQKKDAESMANNTGIVRNVKDITLEDGQYWYWQMDSSSKQLTKYPLSIVTGRQSVPYSDIRKIDSSLDYNYYYTVEKVYFCCKPSTSDPQLSTDYQYYGWYYASYPQNDENIYIKVTDGDGKVPTHYISEAEYKLTPGTGDYNFISDETEDEQSVQVDHIYYKGGYTNHDWFKRYVFHLSPEDSDETVQEQFKVFEIEVDTMTAAEFNQKYGNTTTATSMDDNKNTEDSANENNTPEDSVAEDSGETTSEVESMVSEAGVELVSIEKEISEQAASDIEFQDGSEVAGESGNSVSDEVLSAGEESAPAFTDDSGNTENTFSAGESQNSTETADQLSDYGLIYINGAVTTAAAQAIGDVPVMINSVKASGDAELLNAFSSVIKEDDEDGHYVNTNVYFFKDTFSAEDPSGLINLDFHTNFNSESDGSTFTDKNAREGFEEILKYIESENRYRKIGQTTDGTQSFSDGEDNSASNTAFSTGTSQVQLLSEELTQARAIEYIINYKYRRKLNTKSTFNVLEIDPSKVSKPDLTQDNINGWLGDAEDSNFIKSYNVCCEYTKAGSDYAPGDHLFDGRDDTFWHSDWGKYPNGHDDGKTYHHIEVTFKKKMTITGFDYKPRPGTQAGAENGKIKEFEIHLYSDDNCENEIYTETGSFDYTDIRSDSSLKTFKFANTKTVSGIRSVKIVVLSAGDSKINGGRALSTKFASGSGLTFLVPSSSDPTVPQLNLTNKTASEFVGHIDDICAEYDMIYIGDKVENRDAYVVGSGQFRYVHVGDGTLITSGKTELLKLLGQLDSEYDTSWTGTNGMQRFAPFDTYSEQGGGYLRGSGNDMTEQDYEELMEFVKSGYPVVLGSELVTSDRKADSAKVDAASYYYQFIQEALKYPNVMTKAELDGGKKDIKFWLNLAKPVINFTENGKPLEPVRKGEVDDGSGNYGYIDGELKFTFTVSNDSDASPATATYDCNLYLDLNFDGNFSDKEVQNNYVQIADETGQVLSTVSYGQDDNRYELKAGRTYTLTRKIPKDYFKLITWKLEISNNQNTYIHTSETGYSKQTNPTGAKQVINVLQLVPKNCTWTLTGNTNFEKWMNQVDDFEIRIEGISVQEFGNKSQEDVKKLLDSKQMLIIGFADVYDDISNENHAVDEILDFVKNGKSILFAHDTTSYINYDYNKMYKKIAQSSYTGNTSTETGAADVYYDDYLHKANINNVTWGLSLNKILRSVVGMDRYGITSDDMIEQNGTEVAVSELLKKGNALSSSSVDFKTLMEAAGDIAYQSGDRTKSYGQTQAYTNPLLKQKKLGTSGTTTKTAQKVNDGAITQYPYRIPDTLSVAETHGQYYQLALERDRDLSGQSDGKTDIVVWYCLSGSIYADSPNDVRNNYYFYSNKNVIYTGAGHSTVSGDDEIKLFINAIVAAANVTAVQPEVHFVKSLNPAAETETTRYYMTDQPIWNSESEESNILGEENKNMKFYFNVKDYNMVSADLNPEDLKKQEMTVDLYIDDPSGEELAGDGVPEALKGKKVTNLIKKMQEEKQTPVLNAYGDEDITVGDDNKFHLKQNNAYSFSIRNIEEYLRNVQNKGYYTNCKVYVVVNSTVYLYGQKKSETSWAAVDLKQRQMFDLD